MARQSTDSRVCLASKNQSKHHLFFFPHVKNSFLFKGTICGDVQSKNEIHYMVIVRKSREMFAC